MSEAHMSREDEIREREQKATKGPWKAGRSDTISYHGDGSGPYKNIYVDDPNGQIHMGEKLPATVCEAFDAFGVDCRDNADFIAHAREDVPYLLDEIARLRAEIEELRKKSAPPCEKCKGFGVINKTEMHGKGPAQSLRVIEIPCPNGCEKSFALYAHQEPTP